MKHTDKDKLIIDLQKEIHTLKTIISMMPGNIFWKDLDGNYLGCNNNVAKVLKVNSPEDAIGKTDAELIGQPYADSLRKIDLDVINNQIEICTEEFGPDANNVLTYYLTRKAPLYDRSRNIIGTFGISLDITTLKKTEKKLRIAKKKAEAANRAKSKFLAMVSHELRTPLTSILGFVSFLENGKCSASERKQYIKYIIDSGSYLLSLINNLLDYNKLETKKYELTLEAFDFEKLVINIINILKGSAKLKNIDFFFQYAKNTPKYIISDSHVLQQIFMNLIGNAIKFTDKGQVAIKIECIKKTLKQATFCIAIEDTGIGIHENELPHIFKQFYQAENVYTRNKSLTGTGLGLSIVKKLIHLLEGKIEVVSQLNQGSTFYLTLCFDLAAKNQTAKLFLPHKKNKNSYAPLANEKHSALLIEDDTLIQIIHKQMLEELNCEVSIAESASEALFKLNQSYDIIFVDIGLPDINGFELIKIIRQQLGQKTPIVALTGYSEASEQQQCLMAGANKVIIKPVSKPTLAKTMGSILYSR